VTDRAWTLRAVTDELIPAAFHNTEPYANNRIEADHGRLKSSRGSMRSAEWVEICVSSGAVGASYSSTVSTGRRCRLPSRGLRDEPSGACAVVGRERSDEAT
jgi:transposase-like protein